MGCRSPLLAKLCLTMAVSQPSITYLQISTFTHSFTLLPHHTQYRGIPAPLNISYFDYSPYTTCKTRQKSTNNPTNHPQTLLLIHRRLIWPVIQAPPLQDSDPWKLLNPMLILPVCGSVVSGTSYQDNSVHSKKTMAQWTFGVILKKMYWGLEHGPMNICCELEEDRLKTAL